MKGYKETFIKDLNLKEMKVSISGLIVSKNENNLVIDDNTGILQIKVEHESKLHDYVRVFGNLIEVDGELLLRGDVVQDLNNINKKLHKKIKDLL